MKTKQIQFSLSVLVIAVLCTIGTQSVNALDTDVYLKAQAVGTDEAPNVLIILDTSGSMSDTVQSGEYDPDIDYCNDDLDAATGITGANAGKPSGCSSIDDRIYWSFSGTPPAHTSNQWFDKDKNNCVDSHDALDNDDSDDAGFYGSSKIARWKNSNNWSTLSGRVDNDITYVDCQADGNDDGQSNNDGRRPRNSTSNAYTTSSSSAFNWGGFSNSSGINTTIPTLYSANYMNWVHNTVVPTVPTTTRIQAAKSAVNAIIDGNTTVRFGLMVFNRNNASSEGRSGGRVLFPVDTMDNARRTAMKTVVNNTVASGNTPLAETLYEAYLYFSGKAVYFGDDDTAATPARDLTAETGGTASVGGTYISPFAFSCQTAYVIYVTDGDPTSDSAADTSIRTLAGLPSGACEHNNSDPTTSCLKDLAGYMKNNDLLTGVSALPNDQIVTTYTIGFGTGISADGETLLKDTATLGGGRYITADNTASLTSALQGVLIEALQKPTSFTAPSLSVNAFNRLYNRDDLFLALFKPSNSCAWPGNVKKYRLCSKADIDLGRCDKLSDVVDANNVLATDSNNFIKDTARSKWSTATDGSEVTAGSVGINMPAPASRNIYTYTGSYSGLSSTSPATLVKIDTSATNTFRSYAATDVTRMGLPTGSTTTGSPNDLDTLINWMLGTDSYNKWTYVPSPSGDPAERAYEHRPTTVADSSDNGRRWAFGDVLHSRPVAINYGGTDSAPIIKLFVGTNDGMVHMLNNATGAEQWSFIPKELYAIQYPVSQEGDGDHYIGMDNTPTFWIIDNNKNNKINPGDGDRIYMYIGMRRGGRNIYAFDITPSSEMTSDNDTFTPKLMWVIEGGTGNFVSLGQTWSRPQLTRVRVKCKVIACDDGEANTPDSETKIVLMFGGGYDTNQDNDVAPSADSMGNAIYMVDPLTGQRLWWAGKNAASPANLPLTKMNFSIPSDLALLDTDGDGATDRIYVGDTGGQLWRVDLSSQLDPGLANGTTSAYVFADVGCAAETVNSTTIGSTSVHDNSGGCPSGTSKQTRRRIFFPPDIAPVSDSIFSITARYDMVTIGTGDREDPLDFLTEELSTPDSKEAVHNRIYAFRDYNSVKGAPATTQTPISETDLFNATNAGVTTAADITSIRTKKGWYMDLRYQAAVAMPNGLTTRWAGEKVMASSTIEAGVLKITTYTPANTSNSTISAATCNANEGIATLYGVDLLTANGVVDLDGDGDIDRSVVLGSGIASEVVRIFLPDGNTSLVQAGGGVHSGGPDDKSGGLTRNSWQGCLGAPSSDTSLCGQ